MKLSLITTVKDEAQTAAALISAVEAQALQPDEWIVVDGGSRDGTADSFRQCHRCTVIESACTRGEGRNLAIAHASGEIIAITDAGCQPGPSWLSSLVAAVSQHDRICASGPSVCRVTHPFDAAQHALMDQFVNQYVHWRVPAASCRSLAFRRQTWEECPFPRNMAICEDSWTLEQWRRNGWSIVMVPEAAVPWFPQPSITALVRQYFNYMHGEGVAGLNTKRHLLRSVFYLLLLLVVLAGYRSPAMLVAAAGLWLSYCLCTALRLPEVLQSRPIRFRLQASAWLLLALPLMDLAKICGFAAGSLQRLCIRNRRSSQ